MFYFEGKDYEYISLLKPYSIQCKCDDIQIVCFRGHYSMNYINARFVTDDVSHSTLDGSLQH